MEPGLTISPPGGSHTDNDRGTNNLFDSGDLALRLDRSLGTYVDVGLTVRGFNAHYGDPSDEFTHNPDDYETESNWLATVFADVRMTQYFTSHLTLGGQDRQFDSFSPEYGPPAITEVENHRGVLDWQNTFQLTQFNKSGRRVDRRVGQHPRQRLWEHRPARRSFCFLRRG